MFSRPSMAQHVAVFNAPLYIDGLLTLELETAQSGFCDVRNLAWSKHKALPVKRQLNLARPCHHYRIVHFAPVRLYLRYRPGSHQLSLRGADNVQGRLRRLK